MTIRPVTSILVVNRSNTVNFEGKKKNYSDKSEYIINPGAQKLAIPLAAAITMAPLNIIDGKGVYKNNSYIDNKKIEYVDDINSADAISDDGGTIIESRNFVSDKYGPYKVNLISTDDNNKTFEKVAFESYNELVKKNLSNDVKQLAVYNYQVVSDDGSKSTSFTLKNVLVDSGMQSAPFTYNQNNIVNYIEQLIDDPRNNKAVEKVVYNRTIRPSADGNFQNVGGKDIMKDAVPFKPNGKLIGFDDVTMENELLGTLRYYSYNDNDSDIELVTYQKKGYPELRIFNLYTNKHVFEPYSEIPSSFVTGIMELSDANRKHYYLEEPSLVFALADLKAENPEKFKYGIIGESNTINYLITPKGAIMPVAPEEE